MYNILYYYSSQQVHTGSPRVLMSLIEGLDRSAFKPFFLADHEGDLCGELAKRGTVSICGTTNQITKYSFILNIRNILNLIRSLRRNAIKLVHINELGWNTELAVAAWLIRIPVIFHIHNPEKLTGNNLNCLLGTKYLFVSKALAEQCNADKPGFGAKAEIVYNPIAIGRYAAGKSIRSELGVPEDAPVVGSVAQICNRKGIDIIIRTAVKILDHLPAARFLVAGPDGKDEEDYAKEMRRRVRDLGLQQQFIFCGPRDDIHDFLASLDVFFLPARAEPFGMVIAEAMAARVPVVTSDVGGIPEIIPDSSCGITSKLEDDDFHHSILGLLKENGRRTALAEKGYERVAAMFSDRKFNATIERLYRSVL